MFSFPSERSCQHPIEEQCYYKENCQHPIDAASKKSASSAPKNESLHPTTKKVEAVKNNWLLLSLNLVAIGAGTALVGVFLPNPLVTTIGVVIFAVGGLITLALLIVRAVANRKNNKVDQNNNPNNKPNNSDNRNVDDNKGPKGPNDNQKGSQASAVPEEYQSQYQQQNANWYPEEDSFLPNTDEDQDDSDKVARKLNFSEFSDDDFYKEKNQKSSPSTKTISEEYDVFSVPATSTTEVDDDEFDFPPATSGHILRNDSSSEAVVGEDDSSAPVDPSTSVDEIQKQNSTTTLIRTRSPLSKIKKQEVVEQKEKLVHVDGTVILTSNQQEILKTKKHRDALKLAILDLARCAASPTKENELHLNDATHRHTSYRAKLITSTGLGADATDEALIAAADASIG